MSGGECVFPGRPAEVVLAPEGVAGEAVSEVDSRGVSVKCCLFVVRRC